MIRENNIFIVGIKGVAMANLAVIFKKMGKNVSGSDISEEFITDDILRNHKIDCRIGFSPNDLPENIDLIIYSAAHYGKDNFQIREGLRRGIKIQSQAEVLGQLSEDFKTSIAVCGSHGKTTTASFLAYSLIKLGVKPSYLVGAPSFSGYRGGDYNGEGNNYFVVEADEYGVDPPRDKTPKFYFLKPNYIIGTNIDFDHPDVYTSINELKTVFLNFFDERHLILCTDDLILFQLINRLKHKKIATYGFKEEVDLLVKKWSRSENGSRFLVSYQRRSFEEFTINLFGKKNILNAAGVILTLLKLGFSFKKIKNALIGFTGAKRRFEKIAFINDIYLFDDYGHHPAEIEATIEAVRHRFPKRRLIIIFQPHTFSRTLALKSDFSKSLSLADLSIVIDIFSSAREKKEDFQINSFDIEKEAKRKGKGNVIYIPNKRLLIFLKKVLRRGDVVFTMGAGDVYKLKDDIISLIKRVT